MSEPTLPEKVVALDAALTRARIDHAFGGALALAYYAEPRATVDVDLNLFVGVERADRVAKALHPLGISTESVQTSIEREAQTRVWWGRTPVDLFFSYHPIHAAMSSAARAVPFADVNIRVLGPEHLVVCKVVFDRAKDWLDIAQVLAVVDDFDVHEARQWLAQLLPSNDRRARTFDDLVARLLS